AEIAIRVAGAAIERLAALGALLGHIALMTLWTFEPLHEVLLDVLAGGIAGTGGELAEAPVFDDEVLTALRARLIERAVGLLLLGGVQSAGGFAIGVAGAGPKLAEAPAFEHHGATAVLAVLLFLLADIGGVEIRKLERHLAGVGALRVAAAGQEAAMLAPADDHGLAALLAHVLGGRFHALVVLHVLFGVVEVGRTALVELGQGIGPTFPPLFDLVELFLHAGGILQLEDVLEIRGQELVDHGAELGGMELAAGLGGVAGRAADALLLEFLDERGFGVAWRRLGEVLLILERKQLQRLLLGERGQLVLEGLVLVVALVFAFLVDLEEPIELQHAAGGAQLIAIAAGGSGLDLDRGLIEERRRHLGGHEALPDQLVDLEFVITQIFLHRLGIAQGRSGADGLVRVLRALLAGEAIGQLGQVGRAELLANELARLDERVFGDASRVGAHVGDEADHALGADLDAFIQALRQHHGAFDAETELAAGVLLQLAGDEGRQRIALPLLGFDLTDGVGRAFEGSAQRAGL